jgi:hypothetical protein
MIPNDVPVNDDTRISLSMGTLNQVLAVLMELPAKQVFNLVNAVQREAQLVDPNEVPERLSNGQVPVAAVPSE